MCGTHYNKVFRILNTYFKYMYLKYCPSLTTCTFSDYHYFLSDLFNRDLDTQSYIILGKINYTKNSVMFMSSTCRSSTSLPVFNHMIKVHLIL